MIQEKVVNLGVGDMRAATLIEDLYEYISTRAEGFPVPTVIGALDIVKMHIWKDAVDAEYEDN